MQYRISSTSHTQTAATAVATELHDQVSVVKTCLKNFFISECNFQKYIIRNMDSLEIIKKNINIKIVKLVKIVIFAIAKIGATLQIIYTIGGAIFYAATRESKQSSKHVTSKTFCIFSTTSTW